MKMEKAINDLHNALDYENEMSDKEYACRIEFEKNKLDKELWNKLCKAKAAYLAAFRATIEACKVVGELEEKEDKEYYENLKCTFCGELNSICGGDHGDEMRDIARERGW